MDRLWHDFRYALRTMSSAPVFSGFSILSLAIGIALNSTAFSIADAFLLRAIPGRNPQELASLTSTDQSGRETGFSYTDYKEISVTAHSFRGVLAYEREGRFLRLPQKSQLILVDVVSPGYFSVLGLDLAPGRPPDQSAGGVRESQPQVVISHYLWAKWFNSDARIIGKDIQLNQRLYQVVGIAPASFRGLQRGVPTDAWLPAETELTRAELQSSDSRSFELKARLQPGVAPTQALAELDVIAARLVSNHPLEGSRRRLTLVSEAERLRHAVLPVALLMAMVGLVLLTCSSNVAGMFLSRLEGRRREIAVRLALGAARPGIVRQLLVESSLLGLVACIVGLALTWCLLQLQPALLPPSFVPLGADLRLDGRVFMITVLSGLVAILLFGLVPALQVSKTDLISTLKGDERGRVRRFMTRKAFVSIQIALAVVLLVVAGMFFRSFLLSKTIPLGFDTHRSLLIFELSPGLGGYNARSSLTLFGDLKLKISSWPGIRGTTFARRFPLTPSGGGADVKVSIPGSSTIAERTALSVKYNAVDADYFRTVGTQILRGRTFNPSDSSSSARVIMISQQTAHLFWPDSDAVGKHFLVNGQDCEVIGTVEDIRINDVHEALEPYIYFYFDQVPAEEASLIVSVDPALRGGGSELEQKIRELSPNVPLLTTSSKQVLSSALWTDRIIAESVGISSLMAALLTAFGLFAVVSHFVNCRRREIGIRVALGAQRTDIVLLVEVQGLKLVLIGTLLGLAGAFAVAHLISSFLYGLSGTDPVAFFGACGVTVFMVFAATFYPVHRALSVDPAVVLRQE